ncbi:MAG TPA: DUF2293 domain-containing protein [Mycobacterium sp.]|nr:DUF2293 domain-containing protein [Mycobacterium sp.]
MASIQTRVARVAVTLRAEQGSVRLVDVLVRLGWLAQSSVDRWERGLVPTLDQCLSVDSSKVAEAIAALRHWGEERELRTSEPDHGDLRFTTDGDPDTELAYRTQWGTTRPNARPRGMKVLAGEFAKECETCGLAKEFLLKGETTGVCLDCAGLGHLEFLPSGDAALTRRAAKLSRFSAVVMQMNRHRNRYERLGILAEPAAVEGAARDCLTDADARARRTEGQNRRAEQHARFRDEFAAAIREQFPGCPAPRAEAIALHAAARGSRRIGETAAGRALDAAAVKLAVIASVRHVDTDYDALLMSGVDRDSAREHVRQRVDDVVTAWRDGVALLDESA